MRKITSEVLHELKSDQGLQAGDKEKAIALAEKKILPHLDFAEATRFVMGRAWSRASPEQRKRLVAEFRRLLVRTYANAFHGYAGQAMEVLPVRINLARGLQEPLFRIQYRIEKSLIEPEVADRFRDNDIHFFR